MYYYIEGYWLRACSIVADLARFISWLMMGKLQFAIIRFSLFEYKQNYKKVEHDAECWSRQNTDHLLLSLALVSPNLYLDINVADILSVCCTLSLLHPWFQDVSWKHFRKLVCGVNQGTTKKFPSSSENIERTHCDGFTCNRNRFLSRIAWRTPATVSTISSCSRLNE